MASRHLLSYVLFILAALMVLLTATSLLALPGSIGPVLAIAFLLAGFLFYRRGR